MEKIQIGRITSSLAAKHLAGLDVMDATQRTTPEDIKKMTDKGQCFMAETKLSKVVYILNVYNGITWVEAMQGAGPIDWISAILEIIEAQAEGCKAVGFETSRAGLVKKAKKQGYRITGWTMEKKL